MNLFVIILLVLGSVTATAKPLKKSSDRLRVLLLTYNWPQEHDVIQSLLCTQPCTKENGCPQEYLKYQTQPDKPEVFWNDKFVLVRPVRPGSPTEVVERFSGFEPDMISMSGHHSSGFSGSNGSFALEQLGVESSRQQLGSVFGTASVVALNGCNTEVKSDFNGDPQTYIRHIVEDTEVRQEDLPRIMAAISQISGIQKSYRRIYPNACIMGYQGTSVPGGVPQIYGQYTNALRAMYKYNENSDMKPRISLLTGNYQENEQKVFSECDGKIWPCNLCKTAPRYYGDLNSALAKYLMNERKRRAEKRTRTTEEADALEAVFKSASFYPNSRWACSTMHPSTLPILPTKTSLPNNGKLLLDILLMPQSESLAPNSFAQLRSELLHQIARARFSAQETNRLKNLIKEPDYRIKILALKNSLTEQRSSLRDFYAIAMKLDCDECLPGFESVPNTFAAQSTESRLAFAQALQDGVDRKYFEVALTDLDSAVRAEAALHLLPIMGEDLYLRAISDGDYQVAVNALQTISNVSWMSPKLLKSALGGGRKQVRDKALQIVLWSYSGRVSDSLVEIILQNGDVTEEELGYLTWIIDDRSGESVLSLALKQPISLGLRLRAGEFVRSRHSNQLLALALEKTGKEIITARNAAERLSQYHDVALFQKALDNNDYYVRAGAARRFSERNETSLFLKALSSPDERIRWVAADHIKPNSANEVFMFGLDLNQTEAVRTIVAKRLTQNQSEEVKARALGDPSAQVKSAAKLALGLEK